MANIATLLKKEIQRQTDLAVRKSLHPLALQLRVEKKRVQDLQRQITQLEKNIRKGGSSMSAASVAAPATSTSSKRNWSGSTVTGLRKKHQLSQSALAKLLGVGINTVWLWEQNRTSPRVKQQDGIMELVELSALQVRRRLTKVGLVEGRSKPGRKPGSKNQPKVVATKVTPKTVKKTASKVAKKATKKTVRKVSKKK